MSDEDIKRLVAPPRLFEWDEGKRLANIAKHGIDFSDATEVFADPRHWIYRSVRQADEERYVCVGQVRGVLVTVVFTPREGRIRIISSRAARRIERELYG